MHNIDWDFYNWTQTQSQLLQQKHWDKLDWQGLIEVLEDMGRAERRELERRLEVLILHLLKWQYQPSLRSRSWQLTIREQRLRLQMLLEDSPSLKPYLSRCLAKVYRLAVIGAERETGLDKFPSECPYNLEKIMTEEFLPNN